MVGSNLEQLQDGLSMIVQTLRTDPQALESAYLGVIVFAGKVKTLVPLTDVIGFNPPELPVGGGTALGRALTHLMDEIDRSVITTTADRKGDWKPIVFLMTDGQPTDDTSEAIRRWKERYSSRAHMVAISIGRGADTATLCRLTEDVLLLEGTQPEDFKRFVNWISMSIQTQSRNVDADGDGVDLARLDDGNLERLDPGEEASLVHYDERYAVFVGKCAKQRLPYLLKYELDAEGRGRAGHYRIENAYALTDDYFDLTDDTARAAEMQTQALDGVAACPHCGNQATITLCQCGRLFCSSGPGRLTCPWCETKAEYGYGQFDVTRGAG